MYDDVNDQFPETGFQMKLVSNISKIQEDHYSDESDENDKNDNCI